jgi:hypothetical protein
LWQQFPELPTIQVLGVGHCRVKKLAELGSRVPQSIRGDIFR